MAELSGVLADLTAETTELDDVVAALPEADWRRRTPAPGWTIAHQIAHLAWTDDIAALAATDADAFAAALQEALVEFAGYVDRAAEEWSLQPTTELLTVWRDGRQRLADALTAVPAGTKLPWFGPPMSATSMATARLMETWAHAHDVYDTLGLPRPATDRLRHVAHIGVRTRDFAYLVRDLPVPADAFRIELTNATGEIWTWGPEDALQRVTGPALDFCLLVTQRRHRDDLALVAEGADADAWLDIAQAFAGPPGEGRTKGQFA
ncbi:MAG: hypothetical protein QOC66_1508 [Pseudonocardiales bacterium]|nr:hypothetical protein [Pseudonocardiales bacterium]